MATRTTDKGVGLGILFVLFALVGTGAMLTGEAVSSTVSGAGFAAAVGFGALAIVALHLYPE